mmetsp:Transcript_2181/g.3452  ORF Transcript_2181/g.3452 Transcript_2181/m.3452 type:complete len:287 (+) Transcript_2181:58-918(+)
MSQFRSYNSAIFAPSSELYKKPGDDYAGNDGDANKDNAAQNPEDDENQPLVKKKARRKFKTSKDYIDGLRGEKGLKRLWEEMPKQIRLKGKGHERRDLQAIMRYYREWAFGWAPDLDFETAVSKLEGFGSTLRVKSIVKGYRETNMREWQKKLGIRDSDDDDDEYVEAKDKDSNQSKHSSSGFDRETSESGEQGDGNPKSSGKKNGNELGSPTTDIPPTEVISQSEVPTAGNSAESNDDLEMMQAAMAPTQGGSSGENLNEHEMELMREMNAEVTAEELALMEEMG